MLIAERHRHMQQAHRLYVRRNNGLCRRALRFQLVQPRIGVGQLLLQSGRVVRTCCGHLRFQIGGPLLQLVFRYRSRIRVLRGAQFARLSDQVLLPNVTALQPSEKRI